MLTKLAVLAGAVFLVWNGFKLLRRFRDKQMPDKVIESETCQKCGAYVAMDDESPTCDEAECPYR